MQNHLALSEFLRTPSEEQAGFVFRCWGVAKGDLDAKPVLHRLDLTWQRWTAHQRVLLWEAVNAIVSAEQAKVDWQPKSLKPAYQKAAQIARDAARLAHDLRETLAREPNVIPALQALVSALEELARSGLWATANLQHDMAIMRAGAAVITLRRLTPRNSGRVSWELLRELVWLASRKRHLVDEKTIRRYLSSKAASPTPVVEFWRRNFPIMRSVARVPTVPKTDPIPTAPENDGIPAVPQTGFTFDEPFRAYLSDRPNDHSPK